MFRIATILIILSLAGSEVNCGSWLKRFNCFSSGCTSEDVAPGPSNQRALNRAADSSIAATGPPLSKSASSSSSVDTQLDRIITVDIDVLFGTCKEIDTNRIDQHHWIYVHSCLNEIVTKIDDYKPRSNDEAILEAFNRMSVFDSHYNKVSLGEETGLDDPLDIEQATRNRLEAFCLKGTLDITPHDWRSLQQYCSEQKGLRLEGENVITGVNYYDEQLGNDLMKMLFVETCDLVDKEEPLRKLLVAGEKFLNEAQRLALIGSLPFEGSQHNVRLIRYLLCRKVKEWGQSQYGLSY